jgi:CHAD domain-containing protein
VTVILMLVRRRVETTCRRIISPIPTDPTQAPDPPLRLMAYSFEQHETAAGGILRIAREQLSLASEELDGRGPAELDEAARVHSVRKRTKKLRALLRLIGPALGRDVCRQERARLGQAARQLAAAREASVLVATFDRLVAHYAGHVAPEAFADIRSTLADRPAGGPSADQRQAAADLLADSLARTAEWRLVPEGFNLIARGLADTYDAAQRAFGRACRDGSSEDFHDWRKRTKDHWYHVRLLVPTWPIMLGALEAELHRLSELLGDDHDLADLQRALDQASSQNTAALSVLLERRRGELRREARSLGERVFAGRSKPLVRCFRAYFAAWLREPPRQL